ncbi:MAG TPA: aldo/keto reductase [Tepidisphaeraceae bacterium]|nr:aldo/keto reductase [Tepidisphaeraceae bacterium]
MATNGTLNWGILSTGAIATTFARGLASSRTGKLVAVASRSREKAEKFGGEFNVAPAKRYDAYEHLLADKDVQAVYVATPHPQHTEWAIRAAEAGKHVLVEKPMAINYWDALAIQEAAVTNNVFLMEAFMYRCHPQTAKLVELLREKAVGEVRLIRATFGFQAGFNADSRLFKNAYAGGGILDVGCYAASMARLIAGVAQGKDFADPVEVKGSAALGETGVDHWAAATLKFPGDIVAQLATAVQLNEDNTVTVFGSEGRIHLPNPWVADRQRPDTGKIIVTRNDQKEPQEITVDAPATSFTLEADVFGNAVLSGTFKPRHPAMSIDDTLGNLRTLDRWRDSIRLVYDRETAEGYPKVTASGRPLARSPKSNMKYGRIPGVDKDVSRLIFGCDNQGSLPNAAVNFDDWFARGGNAFDTSFVYGGGRPEVLLGQWMELRGVRDQCVVIAKGLHTPDTYPARFNYEFPKTLERLRTNYADLYVMHRDNPDVPVGEFVDVINAEIKRGRIKAWGGSNWSPSRIDAARDYAKKHGLVAPVALSNNFSLARMVEPVWDGCISASDPQTRGWLKQTQTVLLAWSSQARGFFLPGRAHPSKTDDAEMTRCWYAEDNFKRLARAEELAKRHNVQAINIALAYVLCQPFPTFPLIGPRQPSETRTSLPALDVTLSDRDLKYLNLDD